MSAQQDAQPAIACLTKEQADAKAQKRDKRVAYKVKKKKQKLREAMDTLRPLIGVSTNTDAGVGANGSALSSAKRAAQTYRGYADSQR